MTVKALTICQPYAELIAQGVKLVENREWPTHHRGLLAIHSGKSRDWLEEGDEARLPGMVFGAVVAVATLADCVPRSRLPAHLTDHEHAHGPWCWVLQDIVRLAEPIVVRGAQGLWLLPPAAAALARSAGASPR